MPLFESFRRRVRSLETAHGEGALNLTFPDGSEQAIYFASRNDKLKVLLASFAIANGDPESAPSPRAREIAEAIGKAESVDSDDRLWQTIHGIVNDPDNGADSPLTGTPSSKGERSKNRMDKG
jgi:hypothetical protein